jgi:hypothetical protein
MGWLAAATQSGAVRPPRASWCRLRNFGVLLLAVCCELEKAAAAVAAAAQWRLDNDDCSDGDDDDDHINHVSMVVAATEVIAVDSYLTHILGGGIFQVLSVRASSFSFFPKGPEDLYRVGRSQVGGR